MKIEQGKIERIFRILINNTFGSTITKSTLSTTLVLIIRLTLQAGTLIILANLLGAKYFGIFTGLTGFALILGSLATLGTHLVLLSEISKKNKTRSEILEYSIPTTLITGAALVLFYTYISTWLIPGHEISILTVVFLGASEILFQPLISLASMELLANGRATKSQTLGVIPLFFRLLIALIILIINPQNPLELFSIGYLILTFTSLVFAHRSLRNPWPKIGQMRLPNKVEIKNTLGYAILNTTYQGPTEVDKIISVKITHPEISGAYAIGSRITGALALPVISMLVTLIPRLFAENSKKEKKSNINLLVLSASLIYGVISGSVLYLSTPFLDQLFGHEFKSLPAMIPILAIALPGLTCRIAIGDILMSYSLPWKRAGLEALGISCIIGIALLSTPYQPVLGIPIALAATEWIMTVIGIVIVFRLDKKTTHI